MSSIQKYLPVSAFFSLLPSSAFPRLLAPLVVFVPLARGLLCSRHDLEEARQKTAVGSKMLEGAGGWTGAAQLLLFGFLLARGKLSFS